MPVYYMKNGKIVAEKPQSVLRSIDYSSDAHHVSITHQAY